MFNIDQALFDENLLLTQVYCAIQLINIEKTNVEILRSFNPVYMGGQRIFSFKHCRTQWLVDPIYDKCGNLYLELFELQLKNKKETIGQLDIIEQFNGKILVAEIDSVITDEIAEDETRGFFDENYCPPIDTWFYLGQGDMSRVLFAWIPDKFVQVVEGGKEVNMLGNFYWLDDGIELQRRNSIGPQVNPNGLSTNEADSNTLWSRIKLWFLK